MAAPGVPLLTLYDPKGLRLEAAVEERLAGAVKVGDTPKVRLDALGVELDGRVSEVVPAVDPATRTGVVKIDLPATPGLQPGMFGRARILRGTRAAVAVPGDALVRRGQLELVFWLPKGGDAARMAIVRAGGLLPDGERVSVCGATKADVAQVAHDHGIRIVGLTETAPSLEDTLLELTGAAAEFTAA